MSFEVDLDNYNKAMALCKDMPDIQKALKLLGTSENSEDGSGTSGSGGGGGEGGGSGGGGGGGGYSAGSGKHYLIL